MNGNPENVEISYNNVWANEAGDYSGEPYNQGDAFDFSKIFEGGSFTHSRRRFWPALSADVQGKSLGYFMEVSYDDGVSWQQYLHAFNNLLDECGVWLSGNQLDVETWAAALGDVLKFRMTASVISDERLSCIIADGPIDSVIPVVDHIITVPRQFKYRKVSNQSIFANVSDGTIGAADEVEDSTALFEFVRQKAQVSSEVIETIDVETSFLAFDYQVGDIVTSAPESRDLLGCRSDNRSVRCIGRVQMDFENQHTNLKITRKRVWQL